MSILLEKYFNKLSFGRSANEGSYAEGILQNQTNPLSPCLRPQGCDKLRLAIDRRLAKVSNWIDRTA
ncbi:hypothetical protein [Microcoleus sp. herbarium14]|uniref:hypothetical protein n=1 Tax=Microcoleus sp. herbarium14 TaxID=3055439 RepID=UPI002FD1361C